MFGISRKVKFIFLSLVAIWLGLMLGELGFESLFQSEFSFGTHGTVIGLFFALIGLFIELYFGRRPEKE